MSEKITLQYPIEYNGQKITEIELRRPLVGDQRRAQKSTKNDVDMEIKLFADLSMLEEKALLLMDMHDYTKIREAYNSFLS